MAAKRGSWKKPVWRAQSRNLNHSVDATCPICKKQHVARMEFPWTGNTRPWINCDECSHMLEWTETMETRQYKLHLPNNKKRSAA